MKITKYNHSCLVVEENNKVILIDPGNYSEGFQEEILKHKIDTILITHDHMDHMSIPLIKAALQKYPQLTIIAPQAAVEKLRKEGIEAQTSADKNIEINEAPHEKMFFKAPLTENVAFTVFGKLTHPGDSFHFNKTAGILALPVTAPWGSTVEAYNVSIQKKPKVIIPIHDAMVKDDAIQAFLYPSLTKAFSKEGIEFKGIKNGETIEI